MTENETQANEHVHTDVHDACSIHATLEANHRAQMRMGWAILLGLWVVFMFAAYGPAGRLAEKAVSAGSVSASATALPSEPCGMLLCGGEASTGGNVDVSALPTGSGGSGGSAVCVSSIACSHITSTGGAGGPITAGPATGHGGSGSGALAEPATR
jgi:hypothetical protein